jgi:hypothetical protein
MRHLGWITLASLCVLAACDRADDEAAAAEPAPVAAAQVCPDFPKNPDAGEMTRPIVVPESFASYVRASDTTLTVQRTAGAPVCIDLAGVDVASWETFLDGRLFGATLYGHEYNSYLVVDRKSTTEPVETGVKPTFSPSGRRFASVDISEAGFGAFEALGVWDVTDDSIRTVATIEELLDRGYDWKVVRWASDDCIVFSSADLSDFEEVRSFHELRLTERPALKDVAETAACRSPV